VPRILVSADSSKINACAQNRSVINTAVEQWYFNQGSWPLADLSDIAADTDYFPEGIPVCPVDASVYALDAGTHRVTGHAH